MVETSFTIYDKAVNIADISKMVNHFEEGGQNLFHNMSLINFELDLDDIITKKFVKKNLVNEEVVG